MLFGMHPLRIQAGARMKDAALRRSCLLNSRCCVAITASSPPVAVLLSPRCIRPFYIMGESFAGHYIVPLANKLLLSPVDNLDFRGVGLGNAWIDPINQYPSYPDYTLANKLITKDQYDDLQKDFGVCEGNLVADQKTLALISCSSAALKLKSMVPSGTNEYNIRKVKENPFHGYPADVLETFLNKPETQEEMGVGNTTFQACNPAVQALLVSTDLENSVLAGVGTILDAGKKVLVYTGKNDIVCNWIGAERWTAATPWTRQSEFAHAETAPYNVGGRQVGTVKALGDFVVIGIDDAGHLAPRDAPNVALDMVQKFLQR
eukprot:GHVU01116544.1.p1 GENE.GHVU01116544.1~~GHVU01116544.1.p1  ORF type:complete len:319 (-),score=61.13 GHVU01116544.1:456-1412(-)